MGVGGSDRGKEACLASLEQRGYWVGIGLEMGAESCALEYQGPAMAWQKDGDTSQGAETRSSWCSISPILFPHP